MAELINKDNIDVNRSTKNRTTPLIVASANGHSDIVEMLLAHPNIDPNYATFNGRSSIFNSIIALNETIGLDIVKIHLRCPSILVSKFDEDKKTAKIYAQEKNLTEVVKAFGNRLNLMKDGHTCCSDRVNDGLQITAEQGHLKMVKSLLRCPQVDLNNGYKYGITPLYIASNNSHTKLVEELLNDPRTSVNVEVNSATALYTATEYGNTEVVNLLLNHDDIDVNKVNRRNEMSALMISVEKGHLDIVRLLIPHPQTKVNTIDGKDESAISIASRRGSFNLVKLLIRCPKTNITTFLQKDNQNYGPNIEEVLKYTTELKKLPSTCCLKVEQSLLKAARTGDYRAIRGLLLCPNSDINVVDEKGRSLLYLATLLSHNKVVDVLLNDKYIDVNKGNILDGSNPFAIASKKGHFEILEKLIRHDDIAEGIGWKSDSWTSYITRSNHKSKATATSTTIGTTSNMGKLRLF